MTYPVQRRPRAGDSCWLAALVVVLGAACTRAPGDEKGALTLFAAASTTDVMKVLAQDFETQHGLPVRTSFAASSTLARQIEAGARVDVYVSADEAWMDHLQHLDLLQPDSRRDLAANDLVLIAPADRVLHVELRPDFELAAQFSGKLAVADPSHVPAGRRAKEALSALGWWDKLQPRLVPTLDVRAALALVETGAAGLGVVYGSDALRSPTVRVVARFPPDSHLPIRYPAAVLRGAQPLATDLLRALCSPSARELFQQAGFALVDAGSGT
ncbi:MAG: molybdate ABC transporter substrate-binding protein [Pseudomonadota bacterium]